MGFWSNVGEALFGTSTRSEGKRNFKQASSEYDQARDLYKQTGAAAKQQYGYTQGLQNYYDTGTKASMGANAAEYMQNAQNAAAGLAGQQASQASLMSSQQALRSGRSAGLNPAQAALLAGQGAAGTYQNQYQQGLNQGIQNYQGMTSQFAGQGSEMANRMSAAQNAQMSSAAGQQASAAGQLGVGQAQTGAANQQSANTWGTIGNIAGTVGGLLSDFGAKKNILNLMPSGNDDTQKSSDETHVEAPATPDNTAQSTTADVVVESKAPEATPAPAATPVSDKASVVTAPSQPVAPPAVASSPANAGSEFAAGVQGGTKLGQTMSNQDMIRKLPELIGGIIGAVKSDQNCKKNISDILNKVYAAGPSSISSKTPTLDAVLQKVRPVSFDYKNEPNGVNHIGVIAQDVEQTPLKNAVINTPQGKMIDTRELSTGNLALIIELASRVKDLENKLGEGR